MMTCSTTQLKWQKSWKSRSLYFGRINSLIISKHISKFWIDFDISFQQLNQNFVDQTYFLKICLFFSCIELIIFFSKVSTATSAPLSIVIIRFSRLLRLSFIKHSFFVLSIFITFLDLDCWNFHSSSCCSSNATKPPYTTSRLLQKVSFRCFISAFEPRISIFLITRKYFLHLFAVILSWGHLVVLCWMIMRSRIPTISAEILSAEFCLGFARSNLLSITAIRRVKIESVSKLQEIMYFCETKSEELNRCRYYLSWKSLRIFVILNSATRFLKLTATRSLI